MDMLNVEGSGVCGMPLECFGNNFCYSPELPGSGGAQVGSGHGSHVGSSLWRGWLKLRSW